MYYIFTAAGSGFSIHLDRAFSFRPAHTNPYHQSRLSLEPFSAIANLRGYREHTERQCVLYLKFLISPHEL